MSITLWPYAIQNATFLINILPIRILSRLPPFVVLYEKTLAYDTLKVFGCQYFSCMRDYNHNKFDIRYFECVFLVMP